MTQQTNLGRRVSRGRLASWTVLGIASGVAVLTVASGDLLTRILGLLVLLAAAAMASLLAWRASLRLTRRVQVRATAELRAQAERSSAERARSLAVLTEVARRAELLRGRLARADRAVAELKLQLSTLRGDHESLRTELGLVLAAQPAAEVVALPQRARLAGPAGASSVIELDAARQLA